MSILVTRLLMFYKNIADDQSALDVSSLNGISQGAYSERSYVQYSQPTDIYRHLLYMVNMA